MSPRLPTARALCSEESPLVRRARRAQMSGHAAVVAHRVTRRMSFFGIVRKVGSRPSVGATESSAVVTRRPSDPVALQGPARSAYAACTLSHLVGARHGVMAFAGRVVFGAQKEEG